ncbi:MAG: 2-oxoacid:acceptor oxidoreductase subunit alpha [Bacteroidota bacterium]
MSDAPVASPTPGAPTSAKPVRSLSEVTILFAGDSGDGMQLTGSQFTLATALARNDLATLPDFPAEIRAPAGTTYGVSGFQLHFGSGEIHTPGDEVDLLVAMNPAALAVNLHRVRKAAPGRSAGAVLVNTDAFEKRNLELARLDTDPLEDGTLDGYEVFKIELNRLTRETLAEHAEEHGLGTQDVDRCKNMFALGLALWLYTRPMEPAQDWLAEKFSKKPAIRDANVKALKAGYYFGETTEVFAARYEVAPATLAPGTYRAVQGNEALALGLVAAKVKSGLDLVYGTYPITPASDLLHALSKYKDFGVRTVQAEDEIAAIGVALGTAFGGHLGVTGTSGPGLALKTEFLGLALMTELPLVLIDVQRAGPSTGMPTKTEQSDLLMAVYGRNGDGPVPVIAASSPGDCYEVAYEACRIAVKYMTPVLVLSDGYLGNGSEPWRIPDPDTLAPFEVSFATENNNPNGDFLPYVRDETTLARPWARPGTPGLEHRLGGLEKDSRTGGVSYDPANHQHMVKTRAEKVQRVRQEIPPCRIDGDGEGTLIVGWGSTRGAIEVGVERARAAGHRVGHLHLRWIWPLPADLGDILARYDRVLVPELNNGQLVRLLREQYLVDAQPVTKVQGLPFKAAEIEEAIVAGS